MATKLRRSIFIGLGGTGMKTILKTKSVMMDNYGQNGELPPMFSFLGIDTDAVEYSKTTKSKEVENIGFSEREKLSISVADPVDYFEYKRKEYKWMPHQNIAAIKTLDRGAGQVRSNGRLAFMYNLNNLHDGLRRAISDACNAEGYTAKWSNYEAVESGIPGKTKIDVHVVFSLCGGTGSGTFLDIAYLLRELENESNVIMTLNGYAVMPGVFIEEIPDPTEKARVKPNAYGALRELDYLMSNGADERKVKMPWMKKETSATPFDSLILVDNRNTIGITYSSMDNLTEMLSLALLAATGQIGEDAKSVGDNVKIDMAYKSFDVDGKAAWVAAVGTSTIIFDSKHVARVYELKAQNKLIRNLLAHLEDKNLEVNNWIDSVSIRENKDQDHVIDYLYDINTINALNLTEKDFDRHTVKANVGAKIDLYVQNYMPSNDEWKKKSDALYDTISAAMLKKEKELGCESLNKVFDFLRELRGVVNDIFIKMMNEELASLETERVNTKSDLESRISQLDAQMQKLLFRKANTYISYVINAAKAYLVNEIELKRRSYAAQFYARLVELIDNEIHNVEEGIKRLQTIIDENDLEIRNLQNHAGGNKTVVIDLAEDVIRKVEVENDNNLLTSEFIQLLPTKNLHGEISKDAFKAALEQYTHDLPQCVAYRNRTIDEVLNAMDKEKFEEVVRRAANYSQPFLNIDSQGRKLANGNTVGTQEMFYICVPDIATCRLTKEGAYRNIIKAENAKTISTNLTDRIIIYRQKRPVPAFAIGGIEVMQEPYELEQAKISFHIDQQLQQRMDEEEYSFEPQSANYDEALDAWVMGCILGFVKFDKGSYWYQDLTSKSAFNAKENWVNSGSAFRETAFEQFCENEELIKKYMDAFAAHLEAIGKVAIEELRADVENNYFRKYSRCQVTEKMLQSKREYKDTLELISKEAEHSLLIFNN